MAGFVDICKTNYLTLPFPGDQGFLGVTSSSGPSENSPCILRLSGCSQCRISMHPVGDEWTFPICSNQFNQYSMKECKPGCSYMFVFDSIYLNETLRFYDTSNWQGGEFKSISSAVFIGLCSRPNPPNITFDESDRRRPINGSMGRPIVISKGPEMKVIFSTGNHFLEDQNRYMGFKFTYIFYHECGKNYLINEGGMIDFQLSSSIEGYQYDCTWLIKKQPEFDKVYMKIIKFRTDTLLSYSNQEVVIRDGVTSDGEVLDKITPRSSYGKPFHSTRGFYIRYRGRVRPMDNLQIVFTSYRERGSSGK
uniref:CUB domain-containing protein n=1 Tax=Magallana gigas TaxID=29159 RepID=K1QQ47_MAGGI